MSNPGIPFSRPKLIQRNESRGVVVLHDFGVKADACEGSFPILPGFKIRRGDAEV